MLTTRTKIALAASVQRLVTAWPRLTGRGVETVTSRGGVRWMLDLDQGIDFSIWLLGAFERRTVAAYTRIVKPGMTVVDIGANIGAHTLFLARLVGPKGRVIAVEPTAWAVGRLRKNLGLNAELAKVVSVNQAMLVGSDAEALPEAIYASWPLHGHDVHPKLRALAKTTEGAEAITLDELVRREGLAAVDFIKLDVDGHEGSVLRGGLDTLRRFRPTMIFELSPYILAETGGSAVDLLETLLGLGYRLYDLGLRRALGPDIGELIGTVADGGGINVVAKAEA